MEVVDTERRTPERDRCLHINRTHTQSDIYGLLIPEDLTGGSLLSTLNHTFIGSEDRGTTLLKIVQGV